MNYNPYDTNRMFVNDTSNVPKHYTTNLMNEYKIQLNFHEYTNVKDIFISKSKRALYFPKFHYEQSNYKCLFEEVFDRFILILQNIKPNLIYLNESIQVHEDEMFLPKINIINNKVLPRLIIIPIDIKYYHDNVIIGGHKNIIIINTLMKTITFFEPYGVNLDDAKSAVIYNIIKEHFASVLLNYTFIDAVSPNTEYNIHMNTDETNIGNKFNNYYIQINKYINTLTNVKLNNSNKKKLVKEISKLRKKIKKHSVKDKLTSHIVNVQTDYFTPYGSQYRQELIEDFGDRGGHCVAWSLYLVFLTFINVNLFTSQFMKNVSISSFINNLLLEKINGQSLQPHVLSNLIRKFISYVEDFTTTFTKYIITKAKSSNVIHIKFNNNGDYVIIPAPIIHSRVSNKRLDLIDTEDVIMD